MPGERVFVGLGSNQAEPVEQLRRALRALDRLPRTGLVAWSRLYANPAMGPQPQPDYVNAVAELRTGLAPLDLLDALMDIERRQGRERGETRWAPRTLDLDLLLYGDRQMDHPRLTLPHPGMHLRSFVMHPLVEIAPDVVVPGRGAAADIARSLDAAQLHALDAAAVEQVPQ